MLEKGKISAVQYTIMIITFLLGIGGIMPVIPSAKESTWLLYLVTSTWGMLLMYIYLLIIKSFPNKTLIQILPEIFGVFLGKAIAFLYISYFLLLTSLILRTVGDFLTIVLPQTPIVVFGVTYITLAVFAVRIGLEVIGRITEFLIPLVAFIQITTVVFAFPDMNLESLLPILADGIKPFLLGVIGTFGFPYGELVIFSMILPFINLRSKANKAALIGVLVTSLLFAIFFIRVIALLGPLTGILNYPSFKAVSYIQLGGFFERGESFFLLSFFLLSFLMMAFGKLLICFYATSLGMAQVFNLKDYKYLTTPLALLAVSLSILIFKNSAQVKPFTTLIYPLYAFCLSFILPVLTLLVLKFKTR